MTIYPTVLYIKQHSITKKKYFGKTTKDPYKYKGSGEYWKDHIKKHGKEHVITLWVSEPYIDKDTIVEFALSFSKEHNIVDSDLWANMKPENGLDGGATMIGKTRSAETRQKISDALKGNIRSAETRQKISEAGKGVKKIPRSDEHKQKLSDAGKGKPRSAETRLKISDALKGKPSPLKGIPTGKPAWNKGIPTSKPAWNKGRTSPKIECPHCGLSGGVNNMTRYHFDNCKKKP